MKTEKCLICDKIITDESGSPYSVCYDSKYKVNVWGGDSHEYVGYLCEECGAKLEAKAKINKDKSA